MGQEHVSERTPFSVSEPGALFKKEDMSPLYQEKV